MATSTKSNQDVPPAVRAKRAPAPSKKLTDTLNTATPQLSAHSEAIALKRAEDAKRLADQQLELDHHGEQDLTSSTGKSLSVTAEPLRSVSPAKRSRDESKDNDNPPSDSENNSSTSAAPEKPKSSTSESHCLYIISLKLYISYRKKVS